MTKPEQLSDRTLIERFEAAAFAYETKGMTEEQDFKPAYEALKTELLARLTKKVNPGTKYEYMYARMGGMNLDKLDALGADGWIVCNVAEISSKTKNPDVPEDAYFEPLLGMHFYRVYLLYREVR